MIAIFVDQSHFSSPDLIYPREDVLFQHNNLNLNFYRREPLYSRCNKSMTAEVLTAVIETSARPSSYETYSMKLDSIGFQPPTIPVCVIAMTRLFSAACLTFCPSCESLDPSKAQFLASDRLLTGPSVLDHDYAFLLLFGDGARYSGSAKASTGSTETQGPVHSLFGLLDTRNNRMGRRCKLSMWWTKPEHRLII